MNQVAEKTNLGGMFTNIGRPKLPAAVNQFEEFKKFEINDEHRLFDQKYFENN